MTTTERAQLVLDARTEHGEGPSWHAGEGVLFWVDIAGHRVHRYDPPTGRDRSFDVGQPVSAVAPRDAGGLIMALRDGFGILDLTTGAVRMVAEVETDKPGNRMNDGECDRAGRFWAGTMAFDSRPHAGALYRLDGNYRVTRMLDGVSISNGHGWSLDDRIMYYIDSGTGGVDAFDYAPDTGAISGRRRLITIEPDAGVPDGMTVDVEGFLWIAVWGGWSVRRYAPDGWLDRTVSLPVAQVSSCVFGGPDLGDLYITSAATGLSDEQRAAQPHAGSLFRYRPGVQGLPTNSFKGD